MDISKSFWTDVSNHPFELTFEMFDLKVWYSFMIYRINHIKTKTIQKNHGDYVEYYCLSHMDNININLRKGRKYIINFPIRSFKKACFCSDLAYLDLDYDYNAYIEFCRFNPMKMLIRNIKLYKQDKQ